ncbi:DUF975 family protein [Coprobacter sp.]
MESFKSSIFKDKALKVLSGNWKPSVIVSLVVVLIIGGSIALQYVSLLLYYVVFLAFGSIVSIGCMYVFLDLYRDKKEPQIADLFTPFQQYGRIFACYIQVFIFTILWMLLLIVPGIIKGLSYSMSYFVLKDRPELSPAEAIKESMRLMNGHKADLFILQLSFIGWAILGSITVIGIIWVIPYMYTAVAAFYEQLKNKDTESLNTVTE